MLTVHCHEYCTC